MNCPKCNSPLQAGEVVCSKCGAAVNGAVQTPSAQANKKKILRSLAIAAVVLIVSVAIGASRDSKNKSTNNSTGNNTVQSMVAQAKSKTTLPKQIDANTSLVDITAERNAIRYHYTISGVNTNNVNQGDAKAANEGMKQALLPGLCSNPGTKSILDQGVGIEYAYDFQGTDADLFVAFSKADCAK